MNRLIRIEGDVAYVTLTKGHTAVIDAVDVPLVKGLYWCAKVEGNTAYAARNDRSNGKNRMVRMHRVLLDAPDNMEVDHIDGDGLNNRRSNLRLATHTDNMRNRRTQKNNQSGIKGVSRSRRSWIAQIRVNGKNRYLGTFPTAESAHAAYAAAAKELHGKFARLT
jgi:hypothetical protein